MFNVKEKTYFLIIICLINITYSIVSNIFFGNRPCVSCVLILIFFNFILLFSILSLWFTKRRLIFYINNILISILGIYVATSKIFFKKNIFSFNVKSCSGYLDYIFNIKYFVSLVMEGIKDCHISKQYLLGIQIEYYIIFFFLVIIITCLTGLKSR